MSPRANRRRRVEAPAPRAIDETESWPDGEWVVRPVTGSAATKTYRCPGCDQEIRPATPHLVVWPAEGGGAVEGRRHWHKPCWRARGRRAARVERSWKAPRHG